MKWTTVLVGFLVFSLCGCTESADQTVGEEPASATAADEPAAATEPPTETQSPEVPDLSGVWQATKTVGGQTEQGTVLISQSGMSFTLSFSEGFRCQPADACEFTGTVETLENDDGTIAGYVWMASNSGPADDDGGTYESFFGLQPASAYGADEDVPTVDLVAGGDINLDDTYMGGGQSVYHHPPDPDMEWETYLWIHP